ncbi:hypothetical protein KJ733_00055 [Patescibacteria group bacterium]|nr:hypothetical protein [Patescibacteria group bacterium]
MRWALKVKKLKPKEMNKEAKIVILGVVTVLASVLAWYSLSTVFNLEWSSGSMPILQLLVRLIFPVVAFCLYLALISITATVVHREMVQLPIWILSSFPLLFFFPFSPWLLVISLLQILIFVYYAHRIRTEVKARIKFSLLKTMRWGLGGVIVAIILSISLLYYFTTTNQERDSGREAIDSLIISTTNIANEIIPTQIKGYDPDKTLDQFIFEISAGVVEDISGQLNEELEDSFDNPKVEEGTALIEELRSKVESGEVNIDLLPPEIRDNLYSDTLLTEDLVSSDIVQNVFQAQIADARDEFLKSMDIEAEGTDTISSVIAKIIRKYAFQFLGPYEDFITPLLALSLFFALNIFSFVFHALINMLASSLFAILQVSKFVKINEEKKDVQIVTLE